jgi:hypothetical protein
MSYKNFIIEAQERSSRRKNKWNLLLIPFSFGGTLFAWIVLYKLVALISSASVTEVDRSELSKGLMVIPLFFPSISIGLMFANAIIWCIPRARKVLDEEAKKYPGMDFKSSMKGLAKFIIITLPLALILSFLSGFNYLH